MVRCRPKNLHVVCLVGSATRNTASALITLAAAISYTTAHAQRQVCSGPARQSPRRLADTHCQKRPRLQGLPRFLKPAKRPATATGTPEQITSSPSNQRSLCLAAVSACLDTSGLYFSCRFYRDTSILYHTNTNSSHPDAPSTPRDFSAIAFNDPSLFAPNQSRVLHNQWQLLSPHTPATALSPALPKQITGHGGLGWMREDVCGPSLRPSPGSGTV